MLLLAVLTLLVLFWLSLRYESAMESYKFFFRAAPKKIVLGKSVFFFRVRDTESLVRV